jgi:hypothetical protein
VGCQDLRFLCKLVLGGPPQRLKPDPFRSASARLEAAPFQDSEIFNHPRKWFHSGLL